MVRRVLAKSTRRGDGRGVGAVARHADVQRVRAGRHAAARGHRARSSTATRRRCSRCALRRSRSCSRRTATRRAARARARHLAHGHDRQPACRGAAPPSARFLASARGARGRGTRGRGAVRVNPSFYVDTACAPRRSAPNAATRGGADPSRGADQARVVDHVQRATSSLERNRLAAARISDRCSVARRRRRRRARVGRLTRSDARTAARSEGSKARRAEAMAGKTRISVACVTAGRRREGEGATSDERGAWRTLVAWLTARRFVDVRARARGGRRAPVEAGPTPRARRDGGDDRRLRSKSTKGTTVDAIVASRCRQAAAAGGYEARRAPASRAAGRSHSSPTSASRPCGRRGRAEKNCDVDFRR